MIVSHEWRKFLPEILKLPSGRGLERGDLLTEQFLIGSDGDLDMYYAPHNDYINESARIVIVGITPGWQQMKRAYEEVVRQLSNLGEAVELPIGTDIGYPENTSGEERLLRHAKEAARFIGTMRTNLITMLDACALQTMLGIETSAALFEPNHHLLHSTSIIKYPVFYKGKNYTGHSPHISRSDLLLHYATEVFPRELVKIPEHALVIPLGKTVDYVLQQLISSGKCPDHTYLSSFPHPSGANGHREKQFIQEKKKLEKMIYDWGTHFR